MARRRNAPQQLRAQRTRRNLLLAAGRVFSEAGYAGATVDDIAEAAGCSKGAYYFHFESKEEALLALIDDWAQDRSRALTEAAQRGRSPRARLSSLLGALLNGGHTRSEKRLLLEFWAQAERNPRVARRLSGAQREWRRLLLPAIERAQQAGDLAASADGDALSDTIIALHDGLVVHGSARSGRKQAEAALGLVLGRTALRATG